jgi:hypothetical protein
MCCASAPRPASASRACCTDDSAVDRRYTQA